MQFVSVGLVSGNLLQGVFIGDYTAIAAGLDELASAMRPALGNSGAVAREKH